MSSTITDMYAVAQSLLNQLDISGAQKEIKRLINSSRQSENISAEIYGQILLARTEWARNELDKGDSVLSDVDSLLKKLKYLDDYHFLLANFLEIKALICNYRSDYEGAFKLWFKLLELTSELEKPENFLLNAYLGIGDVYQVSAKLAEAEKCFQYAYDYSLSVKDTHLIVKCGLYLASIYHQQNKGAELIEQLNAMESYFNDESVDQAWQVDYSTYRGLVLRSEGKKQDSLDLAEAQIEKSLKYDYYWGLWKATELKAEILIENSEPHKAVSMIRNSIELMKTHMTKMPSDAYLLACKLFEMTGDYERALMYMKEYRTRKLDELSNFRENMILLSGIKSRYFNLLLENHFLKWQLVARKGDELGT